jgi:hypothetical protein
MEDYNVARVIETSMDGLFDDDAGMYWSAYVDASGRIRISVQDAETDETSHFILTVSED